MKYRESVLAELARHGVRPTADTPPELVREFINDLYLYQIRKLKQKMRSGLIPAGQYASQVRQLRDRYRLLSLPLRFWTEP
jgi:hypothetical protein